MSVLRLALSLAVGATFGWAISTFVMDAWLAAAMLSGGCFVSLAWLIWDAHRGAQAAVKLSNEVWELTRRLNDEQGAADDRR